MVLKIAADRGMGIISGFFIGFTIHSAIMFLFEYQSFWLLLAMCVITALALGRFAKHTNDEINLIGKSFIGANFIGRGLSFFLKRNPSEFEVFATLFSKQQVDIRSFWEHFFVVLLLTVAIYQWHVMN